MMMSDAMLPHSVPEMQGISSAAILAFLDGVAQTPVELHSLMLVRHGRVVAEGWWSPYAAELPHMLFSLSKSFTSTAVGLAVSEGCLSVDDTVISFFPDLLPAHISENLAAMRVRDLLSMATGHAQDATAAVRADDNVNWAQTFLAQPVEFAPGTHFVYNSAATYMLSAIVQRQTGQKIVDYLRPRLFDPLGIGETRWEESPQGVNSGGWGLNLRTADIAKFGQLYLQRGVWQGRQLIPAAWIAEATSRQISNGVNRASDWEQGYGYQFWRSRHNAYRGDGAFGQFCVVIPEQDAVLAMISGEGNMQAILDLVWRHLLPAMTDAALPVDAAAEATLCDRLAGLALTPQAGEATVPAAAVVMGREYRIEPDAPDIAPPDPRMPRLASLRLDVAGGQTVLTLRNNWGEDRVVCGYSEWALGHTRFQPPIPDQRVAAAGAWTSPDTYTAQMRSYETPFCFTLTCRFDGDRVTVNQRVNVSFGPLEAPALTGHAA
jgi:CubicO group peptidase (beta-lactamase class C family)